MINIMQKAGALAQGFNFDNINTTGLAGAAPGTGRWTNLSSIIYFTINLVFLIGLALALLFVIIGGIKYITSGGDEGKAGEARNTITNAVIGAVVIIGFRVILQIVMQLLGWDIVDSPISGSVG